MLTQTSTDGSWLPLIEYSIKSGLSLSTLRRRIKNNSIPFKLEHGKYLVLFSGVNTPEIPGSVQNPAESDTMLLEAYELAIRQRDEKILALEKKNREIENRLNEMQILVRMLEEKYQVRY